jgi:hypothetical protein
MSGYWRTNESFRVEKKSRWRKNRVRRVPSAGDNKSPNHEHGGSVLHTSREQLVAAVRRRRRTCPESVPLLLDLRLMEREQHVLHGHALPRLLQFSAGSYPTQVPRPPRLLRPKAGIRMRRCCGVGVERRRRPGALTPAAALMRAGGVGRSLGRCLV